MTENLYYQEIKKYPILLQDEEYRLLESAQAGNYKDRDYLIKCNLRLVLSIAKRYLGHGLDFDDLVQEGNIGLLYAVDKFNMSKGNRFNTYAAWWVRQTINRAIEKKGRPIRFPSHVIELINKRNVAERQLVPTLGYIPSDEQLAAYLNIPEDDIKDARELQNLSTDSYDTALDPNDEDSDSLGSFLEDTNIKTPEQYFDGQTRLKLIDEVLNTLDEREKSILEMRFGLLDDKPRTLEEVGIEYNITKERVRQIETKALRKLRNPVRAQALLQCLS